MDNRAVEIAWQVVWGSFEVRHLSLKNGRIFGGRYLNCESDSVAQSCANMFEILLDYLILLDFA
jgi:hypothetical protein